MAIGTNKPISQLDPGGIPLGDTPLAGDNLQAGRTYKYGLENLQVYAESAFQWSPFQTYALGNIRYDKGIAYRSIQNGNSGKAPATNPTFWAVENSAVASVALMFWTPGVYARYEVIAVAPTETGYGIFRLTTGVRPFKSTDFAAELLAGDWVQIGGDVELSNYYTKAEINTLINNAGGGFSVTNAVINAGVLDLNEAGDIVVHSVANELTVTSVANIAQRFPRVMEVTGNYTLTFTPSPNLQVRGTDPGSGIRLAKIYSPDGINTLVEWQAVGSGDPGSIVLDSIFNPLSQNGAESQAIAYWVDENYQLKMDYPKPDHPYERGDIIRLEEVLYYVITPFTTPAGTQQDAQSAAYNAYFEGKLEAMDTIGYQAHTMTNANGSFLTNGMYWRNFKISLTGNNTSLVRQFDIFPVVPYKTYTVSIQRSAEALGAIFEWSPAFTDKPEVKADTSLQVFHFVGNAEGTLHLVNGGSGSGTTETGATIKTKLEALAGDDRLDASAIKNLPSGDATREATITALTIANNITTYTLVQRTGKDRCKTRLNFATGRSGAACTMGFTMSAGEEHWFEVRNEGTTAFPLNFLTGSNIRLNPSATQSNSIGAGEVWEFHAHHNGTKVVVSSAGGKGVDI
jgi:hypothetical protein